MLLLLQSLILQSLILTHVVVPTVYSFVDPQSFRKSFPIRASALCANLEVLPWRPDAARIAEFWGRKPVLFQKAFPPGEGSWASYEDVVQMSADEDVEVRLVRCPPLVPSAPSLIAPSLDAYDVEVGPFEYSYVSEVVTSSSPPFSFLLNDVDRFLPSLADWMSAHFSFVPNWRRDDGQVSLSSNGGGIGLHVDDYDVFLVQTGGERSWTVELQSLGVAEELDRRWVRGIDGLVGTVTLTRAGLALFTI